MQNLLFSIVFSIICLGSLSAQTFIGKINPFPSDVNKQEAKTSGQLRVLAAMVEFQQDKDGSTVGNGKFGSIYSKDYGKTILDPLPFDQAYFSVARICGACTVSHALSYSQAVEKAAGCVISERAANLRIFVAELERLYKIGRAHV